MTHAFLKSRRGGAALEYILISTFAAALSVAALVVVTGVIKDELGRMSERLGVTVDTGPIESLGGTP